MDNSKLYLLKAIIKHETNGYNSLGELNGKHVDDIARLMNEFVKEVIKEIIPVLNTGKPIDVDGMVVQLKPYKKTRKRAI
jgi:hypothetical protein